MPRRVASRRLSCTTFSLDGRLNGIPVYRFPAIESRQKGEGEGGGEKSGKIKDARGM